MPFRFPPPSHAIENKENRPCLSPRPCSSLFRFNRTTPFLHQPGMYNPEDYHRHFNNQSQPSAMLDQSFLSEVSGQPTSLPMYHHQQAMATFQQQQQQQQQRATPLVMDRSYHTDSGYYQPRCFYSFYFTSVNHFLPSFLPCFFYLQIIIHRFRLLSSVAFYTIICCTLLTD